MQIESSSESPKGFKVTVTLHSSDQFFALHLCRSIVKLISDFFIYFFLFKFPATFTDTKLDSPIITMNVKVRLFAMFLFFSLNLMVTSCRRPPNRSVHDHTVVSTEGIHKSSTESVSSSEPTIHHASPSSFESSTDQPIERSTESIDGSITTLSDEPDNESYLLAASSRNVLRTKKVNNELVCSEPGLFADVNNNCEIFHMCHLTERADGSGFDLRQYSFFCGSTTIFDQYTLTCQLPEKAIPCEYAPEFYSINRRASQGEKHVPLHRTEEKLSLRKYYNRARTNFHRSYKSSATEEEPIVV